MGKILDSILDSAGVVSPLLGEMRWNQLNREYEREKRAESERPITDFSLYNQNYKAEAAAYRRRVWASESFELDLEYKYSDMLEVAKKRATPKSSIPKLPSNVLAGEIDNFLKVVEEELKILLEIDDFEYDRECYEYEAIECCSSDYNDSGFETESEARGECRQAIRSIVEDVKDDYESEKSDLISSVKSEMDCMILHISSVKEKFCKIFTSCANDVISDDVTREYVVKRFNDVYKDWNVANRVIDEGIDEKYEARVNKEIKSYFKTEESDVSKQRELFDLCDVSVGWRYYKYNTSGACRALVREYSSIIKCAMKELPFVVFRAYEDERLKHIVKLYKIIYMLK